MSLAARPRPVARFAAEAADAYDELVRTLAGLELEPLAPQQAALDPLALEPQAFADVTAATRFAGRFLAAAAAALWDDGLADRLALPEWVPPLLSAERLAAGEPIWRLDGFLTPAGFRAVEANVDTGLGGFDYWHALAGLHRRLHGNDPALRLTADPVATLAGWLRRLPAPIAYVDYPRPDPRVAAGGRSVATLLSASGVPVGYATYDELPHPGPATWLRGFMAASGLLQHPDTRRLYEWGHRGTINLVAPATSFVLGNKLLLAEIHGDRLAGRVPAAALGRARRLFPPTRRVAGDRQLERRVRDDPARYVLKKGLSHAGRHVVVGAAVDPAAWHDAWRHACAEGDWVCQRRIDPSRHRVRFLTGDGSVAAEAVEALVSPLHVDGQVTISVSLRRPGTAPTFAAAAGSTGAVAVEERA